ncbi:hypothetical protein PXT00_001952 [Salmonella enterica]|nr:hypothetical protein [Salmonella enterica]
MCGITSINQAKQQRERDEAELRSVREMTEQHQKAMDYLHVRARELVNRLGLNKLTAHRVHLGISLLLTDGRVPYHCCVALTNSVVPMASSPLTQQIPLSQVSG